MMPLRENQKVLRRAAIGVLYETPKRQTGSWTGPSRRRASKA